MKLQIPFVLLLCAALSACKPAHSALERVIPASESTTAASTALASVVPAHADLAYAGTHNPAQMLDVYLPDVTVNASEQGRRPLVVFIHGGAWMIGDKAWVRGGTHMQLEQFLHLLLRNGYAVASQNYRLVPEGVFPAPIHDVKAAVRYLRAHANELGINPERIAVVGESAGAHLAQLLAVSAGEPSLEGDLGNAAFSSRVKAVVSYYGIADLRRLAGERIDQGCKNPWVYDPNKPNEAYSAAATLTHLSGNSARYWPVRFTMWMRVIRPCCCCTGGRIALWPLSSRRTCTMLCKKPVCRANCA